MCDKCGLEISMDVILYDIKKNPDLWWVCFCHTTVEGKCEHGNIDNQCSACMYAANE